MTNSGNRHVQRNGCRRNPRQDRPLAMIHKLSCATSIEARDHEELITHHCTRVRMWKPLAACTTAPTGRRNLGTATASSSDEAS
jgi:hypothetical protein